MSGRPRRAANGQGSVYRRTDGRWCAAITLPTGTGTQRKHVYAKTRRDVLAELNKIRRALDDGLAVSARRPPTLTEYGRWWIETCLDPAVALGNLEPTTYDSYVRTWQQHIVPALGAKKITELNVTDVNTFLAGKINETSVRGRPRAPRSVAYLRTVLRRALTDATREGLVRQNVAALAKGPRLPRSEVVPLSTEEVLTVFAASAESPLHALWVTLLGLGLRLGEALALRWSDIDFDTGTVTIARRVQRLTVAIDPETGHHRTRLVVREGTKTHQAPVSMAAPAFVTEALRHHRTRQARQRLQAATWAEPELVFTTPIGSLLEGRNLLNDWKALCARCGIERNVRIHDLRHSTASLLLEQGVPMRVIMDVLRHTRMSTTSDLYVHLSKQMSREAANALDVLFDGTGV